MKHVHTCARLYAYLRMHANACACTQIHIESAQYRRRSTEDAVSSSAIQAITAASKASKRTGAEASHTRSQTLPQQL